MMRRDKHATWKGDRDSRKEARLETLGAPTAKEDALIKTLEKKGRKKRKARKRGARAPRVGGATHLCARCGGKGYYLTPGRPPEEHCFCGRCGGTGTRPKGQGGLFE